MKAIDFLRDLSLHNDKVWFEAHKAEYLEAKGEVEEIAADLIKGIREFDDTIGAMTPSSCTYRIYRDLRFSKDKTPYKNQMGIYVNRGGKKSGFSGYYFQISAGDDEYAGGHMIAIGDYWCDPQVLKVLREDIELGHGDFGAVLAQADPRLQLDTTGALKKVPAGFPKDSPDSEYFKLKKFCLYAKLDDEFVGSPDLVPNLLEICRSGKPFLDYINRAIEYVREESQPHFSSLDY